MDRIRQLNDQAIPGITRALTKMFGAQVQVTATAIEERRVGDGIEVFSPEEIAATTYLPVKGDIQGSALLVFPGDVAFKLCDIVLGRPFGETREAGAMEEAVLKELGNIICGNYLSRLSEILQVEMIEGLPEFGFGMAQALVEEGFVRFARRPQNVLLIRMSLEIESAPTGPLLGHVIFIFNEEAERAMVEALRES